ncbi:MAG: hypothetical protein JXA11_07505 [Phycisphaerae bacterium]|nr:hypothetical protein [Phycisphaerae bacterium]
MRNRISYWITAGVVGFSCVTAWAAQEDGFTSPELEGEFPWRAIGAAAICFAGVLLAGLKNSRRSQQKAG